MSGLDNGLYPTRDNLKLFKIHFQSGGANSDITTRTIEAVRKSKEALDLFTTGA